MQPRKDGFARETEGKWINQRFQFKRIHLPLWRVLKAVSIDIESKYVKTYIGTAE